MKDAFFADKACAECGSTDRLTLRNDSEDRDLSNLWCWKRELREAMLARCRVLCRNCWQKSVAVSMNRKKGPHGLLRAYRTGCLCRKCIAERKQWQLYWRHVRRMNRHQPTHMTPTGVIDPQHVLDVLNLIAGNEG